METNKIDYRKTLNLPQTDFSMKANLTQREPLLLEKWEKEGVYRLIREKSAGKKKFVLHDGPPYANGNIHIGHALNKILKDMIVKFRTMEGYDSPYVPGWDCHGLPIEHQLLKELKLDKSKVERVAFRRKAHDYAMNYVGIQREQFKRLGIFGDWENPYLTLTPEYEYWILKSLAALQKDGYVYRGLKPVNWCFSCETALAEAEVEYEDHTSPSVYVKFQVSNPEAIKGLPKGKKLSLLVWTTTPWTLLANVAVAVHATYKYSFVDIGDEILVAESTLINSVLAKKITGEHKAIKEVDGTELTKLTYAHPFGVKENCPVVTVDYVTKEEGTGLVHTAPGHGQEDFETGLKYKLDVLMPVDQRGIFGEKGGAFAGQHVFKANANIIEDLSKRGLLFLTENISHSYPHCWRCKNPVIFRATEQWFLKIDHKNLRHKLIEAIKRDVKWIPEAGQERILGMVNTRPDWCLSRQRYWGVPIPAVVCKYCKDEHILSLEVIEKFADVARKEGSDAWFIHEAKDFVGPNLTCKKCGKNDFEKTNDILDVWFDSGVSHQAVAKAMMKEKLPVAMYLEGSDQHRGWFQSSLIPGVAIEGKPPYASVLTHGFVVDGQGRKMSKSLGNVISPLDIIKNYGADILRLWVASSNYNDDIRISKEILERLVDAYRKIRNTFRFILSNLYDYNPENDRLDYGQLQDIDKWALGRLSSAIESIKGYYDTYEFDKAYKAIYAFCNDELSSIYLDILKDRLYTAAAKSPARRAAQTVLYDTLDALVKIAAPILSFTCQEVFEAMPKTKALAGVSNVHVLDWPVGRAEWKNAGAQEKLKIPLDLRPYVLKSLEEKRQTGAIGSPLEAKVIFETASDRDFKSLESQKNILASMYIVSQAEVKKVSDVAEGLSQDFAKTRITIDKAEGQKCSRCWNYSTHVGKDKDHTTLCERCVPVVKGLK